MKLRALALALLCACASYHLLPLPAASGTAQALPVRYEKRRLLFFTSTEVDGLLERIFASGPEVLATVVRPRSGVFASGDAGGTWKFAELPAQQSPPQVFREVLFDPRDPRRIYARTGSQVLRSEDGGSTWTATIPGGEVIDALAMGAGGAVLAAGRGRIFVSEDGARTWRPMEVQTPAKAWRARNLAADPAHPGTIYLSLHADAPPPEPGKDLLSRLQALLDYSSDEAVSALALADAREEKPGPVAWASASGDGLYVTHDGGALWHKSGLALDAWATLHDGALYAAAADPILQAAALVRRYPDLAALAERQLRGDKADPEGLRAACRFPGREKLLQGPIASALVFRSLDGGATWSRLLDPPLPAALALREAVERASWDPAALRPAPREPQRPVLEQNMRRGRQYEGMQNPRRTGMPRSFARIIAPETLLSLVDPMRLLAHFNAGDPLGGVSGDAAYAATEAWWNALAEALSTASAEEAELSLGPGAPKAPGGAAFELLHTADGGATWQPQPWELPGKAPWIVPFPASIAAASGQVFMLVGGRDARGQVWRAGFRIATAR